MNEDDDGCQLRFQSTRPFGSFLTKAVGGQSVRFCCVLLCSSPLFLLSVKDFLYDPALACLFVLKRQHCERPKTSCLMFEGTSEEHPTEAAYKQHF